MENCSHIDHSQWWFLSSSTNRYRHAMNSLTELLLFRELSNCFRLIIVVMLCKNQTWGVTAKSGRKHAKWFTTQSTSSTVHLGEKLFESTREMLESFSHDLIMNFIRTLLLLLVPHPSPKAFSSAASAKDFTTARRSKRRPRRHHHQRQLHESTTDRDKSTLEINWTAGRLGFSANWLPACRRELMSVVANANWWSWSTQRAFRKNVDCLII